jgi:hypothetical protein
VRAPAKDGALARLETKNRSQQPSCFDDRPYAYHGKALGIPISTRSWRPVLVEYRAC